MEGRKTVYIRDFAEQDDAASIRAAIRQAVETGADTVSFEPRRYLLQSFVAIQTEGFAHDAGSLSAAEKDCHIPILGAAGLTLRGAIDENGEPATVLVGYNDLKIHGLLPAILWCEDCPGLQLRNIAFTREPEYASAGVVTAKSGDKIEVEVFPGNPCYDGMGAYCMNRINPKTGALTGESVTYGYGTANLWKLEGPGRLSLVDSAVAAKVEQGEFLSWHQGAQTDFQTYFARCDSLRLSNLRTYNANGFCMLAENCRDITADRVVFKPDGNRLFTAPRDAWKLFKCRGSIEMSRMSIHGVRMDGQNMHSNWLSLKEKTAADEAVFFCRYTFASLDTGSMVDLHHEEEVYPLRIRQWSHEGSYENGQLYRIAFDGSLPECIVEGSLGAAACWEPDRYLCKDSEFVNIAGAGHLVRFDHLVILNCTYRNTMNPGILLGAELPTHWEGGHATDILIKGCEFDNCGFFPRYGASGCIGIRSYGFSGKFNRNIIIADNVMRNSAIGVHAVDADQVYLIGNTFQSVEQPVARVDHVTGRIVEEDNRII
ncbi:MAG: hypothetical protein K0R57_274 [Paenibacillaceae bacterium]|jgi:hypothetical protein|nr:hypothetical protein [Paenibacillaceae bacterium]